MSKHAVRENFQQLNRYQISLQDAQHLALQGERSRDFSAALPNGISAGLSSGTSGQRGIFLVSPEEQNRWAGTIIAKVLSSRLVYQLLNPFAPPLRAMLLLRSNSNLYAATTNRRLKFHYGDLTLSIEQIIRQMNDINPDILVAPSSVLRHLAFHALSGSVRISPRQVISAAEVLESDDRAIITSAWHVEPGELYQCTEGFLGCSCEAGRLHLNEEMVHVEPEWLDEEKTRFTPLITDFTRRTQAFVRYRLDDILVNDPTPCPCGRITRVLKSIEGRHDDVLWLTSRTDDSTITPIFPDLIRRAFMLAISDISDYYVRQTGDEWQVAIEKENLPANIVLSLQQQIHALATGAGCKPPAITLEAWTEPTLIEKRRRIQCLMKPLAKANRP